jgi:NAD+ synthase
MSFSRNILDIKDISGVCDAISSRLSNTIRLNLHRTGGVVGISGGIDSSVALALAVKALGSGNVLGLIMPEKDSNNESARLAMQLANIFKVKTIIEDLTSALDGLGCYKRRDEAVRTVFPDYDPLKHKMKIGIKSLLGTSNLPPVFHVTIVERSGAERSARLTGNAFKQIMAASNFKQRCRMAMLYYHAERLHYAVIGTPNRNEYEQGFFVKYGDGGADVLPIAHLYKTQVYQLARFLRVPEEIIERTPTTDTYSAEQTQEEFFYQLPFEQMDLLWYAYENSVDLIEISEFLNISSDYVSHIFENFDRKKRTTEYLRLPPVKQE